MAKIAIPTVAVLRPEAGKSHEQNLAEIFQYVENMTSQTPEDFTIQLIVPLTEMPIDEVQKLVKQAELDAEAMEKRQLEPQGIDPKDGKMLYKLKG